jgi:hypothetical protein
MKFVKRKQSLYFFNFLDVIMNLRRKYLDALEKEGHYVRGNIWAKKVKHVDTTKPSGYAFEGEWLPMSDRLYEYDLKEGDIIILSATIRKYTPRYWGPLVQVWKIKKVGKDDFEYEKLMEATGSDWALKIRDELAKIVNVEMPMPTRERIEEVQKEIEKLEEMLREKKYELEKLKLEEMKKEVV